MIHVVTSWDLCTAPKTNFWNLNKNLGVFKSHLLFQNLHFFRLPAVFSGFFVLSPRMFSIFLWVEKFQKNGTFNLKPQVETTASGAAANKRRCQSLSLQRAAQVSSLPKVRLEAVTSGVFPRELGMTLCDISQSQNLQPIEYPYPICQHLAENENGLPESSSISTGLNKPLFPAGRV